MTTPYALWHLREAAEELNRLIRELESDADGFADGVGLAHVYHHLNTAWNSKEATAAACDACDEADFRQWRRFPTDLPEDFSG